MELRSLIGKLQSPSFQTVVAIAQHAGPGMAVERLKSIRFPVGTVQVWETDPQAPAPGPGTLRHYGSHPPAPVGVLGAVGDPGFRGVDHPLHPARRGDLGKSPRSGNGPGNLARVTHARLSRVTRAHADRGDSRSAGRRADHHHRSPPDPGRPAGDGGHRRAGGGVRMIRLSPTAVLKYETCPYQYLLEEVLRIRPAHRAANLVFGTVLHRTVEDWLRGELTGAAPDPIARFDRDWAVARDAGGIEYSATQSPECLTATGRALITGFATAWPTFQRLLAVDGQGTPLLELKLEVRLGPRLTFVGRTDLLTFNRDGELECLDLKTPSTPTDPGWLANADQLTGYQLLLDAHAERLEVTTGRAPGFTGAGQAQGTDPDGQRPGSPRADRGATPLGRRNGRLRPESTLGGGGHRAGPVSQTRPDGAQHPVRAVRGTGSVPIRRPGRFDRAAENRPRRRRLRTRARG